jgi:hypothetical protein
MSWIRDVLHVVSPFDTGVTCRARTRRSSQPPGMPGSLSRPRADARTKDALTTVASLRRVNGSSLSTDRSDLKGSLLLRTARGTAMSVRWFPTHVVVCQMELQFELVA